MYWPGRTNLYGINRRTHAHSRKYGHPYKASRNNANPAALEDSNVTADQRYFTISNGDAAPSATYHPEIVKYIGLLDDSLPEGAEFWGASLLDGENEVFITHIQVDNQFLLLLSNSERRVTDVLIFPQLGEDQIITTNYCIRYNQEDPYIVKISRMNLEAARKRFLPNENIVQAWRIDPGSGRIESIGTEGIECSAEGGYDPNYVTYKYLKQLSP